MNSLMSITPKELRRAANIREKIISLEAKLDSLSGEESKPVKVKRKRKRTVSAETRARMAAVAKARWAKARRAGRHKL
jgi:hypothetical protein